MNLLFRHKNLFAAILMVSAVRMPGQSARAQQSEWAGHTSMRRVNAIDAGVSEVWTATSGGVFGYDVESGEISTFTAVDGLHNVNVRTVTVDEDRGYVWFGYGDGVLDRMDPAETEVVSFRDIERATQFSSRGINRILVRGDSLLIATQFGIVVFDPTKSEVRDSYTRLGSNPAATEVHDIVIAPGPSGTQTIWAATEYGVARAPLNAINLQDPAAWAVESDGFQPGSELVLSLAFFDSALFAGTDLDLYRRSSDGGYTKLSLVGRSVTGLRQVGDKLFGVSRFSLLLLESGGAQRQIAVTGFQDPISIAGDGQGGLWFGDAVRGLAKLPGLDTSMGTVEALFTVIPEGPYDGLFSQVIVDADANVWAGGVSGAGTGVYMRSLDGEWTTYSSVFYPELSGINTFTRIVAGRQEMVWAAGIGGVTGISGDGDVYAFDETNSSLEPATGTADYLPTGGIATDADGTLWVTTKASSRPFHVRTTDGTWTAFGPYIGQGLTSRSTAYDRIFVDSFGEKWIVVLDENNFQVSKGLLVVDTGSPEDAGDDAFQFFGENGSAGQGLPSRSVRFVTEDRDGLVWIGTESGPAYFVNTGIVAQDASARAIWPQWADRSEGTFMLFGLAINGIAVDPANQLWFATNNGAWLVRPVEGGYETVHHFTTDNSPLFSDEVLSVAVNGRTGEVFLSTSLGLLSYQGDAVTPSASTRDLFVYPNPVHITGNAAPDVYIDGLVEETDIRIMTAAGSLVRRLSARGGRVRWDGRNESGHLVASGVYLVVAVGTDGEGAAHGKVAVIR